MGSWGSSPTESDDFGDAFDGVRSDAISAIEKEMDKARNNRGRSASAKWAAVGIAMWGFNAHILDHDHPVLREALIFCEEVKQETDGGGYERYERGRPTGKPWPDRRVLAATMRELNAIIAGKREPSLTV